MKYNFLAWACYLFCWLAVGKLIAAEKQLPPHIILILLDDLGWRDVGFMGNEFVETPHIDRLATQGLTTKQQASNERPLFAAEGTILRGKFLQQIP